MSPNLTQSILASLHRCGGIETKSWLAIHREGGEGSKQCGCAGGWVHLGPRGGRDACSPHQYSSTDGHMVSLPGDGVEYKDHDMSPHLPSRISLPAGTGTAPVLLLILTRAGSRGLSCLLPGITITPTQDEGISVFDFRPGGHWPCRSLD